MWNFVEMIDKTKPKAVLWENVPGCLSGKMKATYQDFCQALRNSGYVVHEMRHNAKFFGVPQNRDRVFVLAIRKDQDTNFVSPVGYDCGIRLKDVLQKEVELKFYLSDTTTSRLLNAQQKEHKPKFFEKDSKETINTITASMHKVGNYDSYILERAHGFNKGSLKEAKIFPTVTKERTQDGNCCLVELTKNQPQANRVYDPNGVSVTLSAQGGGLGAKTGLYLIGASRGRNPDKPSSRVAGENTEQRLEIGGEISNTLTSVQKDNLVIEPQVKVIGNYSPSNHQASRIVDTNGLAPTVMENHGTVTAVKERFYKQAFETLAENDCAVGTLTQNCGADLKRNGQGIIESSFRIRKLTPKECFRLMGFLDEDFYKCQDAGISNSQLYKQAGNSIVVNVLMAIFGQLYGVEWQDAVYGKWKKTEQERNADLPLFALLK